MSLDLNLVQENIEEYVNDDNKIVTYRWLSLTLNLNVNVAKQALHSFVHHQRDQGGNDDINVTYFVAGLGQTKSGDPIHKCIVVPESHLDVVKSSLNPVTSCHIYSVQKTRLKDYTALYQTDYDIIKQNLGIGNSNGSIKCPWAAARNGKVFSKPDERSKTPVKSEDKKPVPNSADVASAKTNASSGGAKAKKPEPKGSIASMFSGAGKKPQSSGNDKEKTPAAQPAAAKTQSKPAPQKKGVAAFFGKQAASKPEAQPAKASEDTKAKQKASPKPKQKKPREESSDDEGVQRKKRRRIKTDFFDSSEDEEEQAPEEEEQMATSDVEEIQEDEIEQEEDKEKPVLEKETEKKKQEDKKEETKIVTNESGRRRKRTRKLVPKQYVDEEGFMVTEKVWESDSTDADEEEMEEERKKKEEEEKRKVQAAAAAKQSKSGSGKGDATSKPAPKKSTASPQKGKQTSLMSFFKKK